MLKRELEKLENSFKEILKTEAQRKIKKKYDKEIKRFKIERSIMCLTGLQKKRDIMEFMQYSKRKKSGILKNCLKVLILRFGELKNHKEERQESYT